MQFDWEHAIFGDPVFYNTGRFQKSNDLYLDATPGLLLIGGSSIGPSRRGRSTFELDRRHRNAFKRSSPLLGWGFCSGIRRQAGRMTIA
jgi:hypothetical protein